MIGIDATPTLQVIGSGDAFGSGGRLQTCICLSGAGERILIDCGASSLIGLRREHIDPNEISLVVLSHLHGDHFGGVPFLILDGQFRHRDRELVVAGPPGTRDRVQAAMEVLFPGSSSAARRFEVRYVELVEGVATQVGRTEVTGMSVMHASGAPAFALRLRYGGRVVAYSGDTEWCAGLVAAAAGAAVFLCEAYTHDRRTRYHLDFATIRRYRSQLACERIVLTHLGPDMLAQQPSVTAGSEVAHDGLSLAL